MTSPATPPAAVPTEEELPTVRLVQVRYGTSPDGPWGESEFDPDPVTDDEPCDWGGYLKGKVTQPRHIRNGWHFQTRIVEYCVATARTSARSATLEEVLSTLRGFLALVEPEAAPGDERAQVMGIRRAIEVLEALTEAKGGK